MKLHLSSPTKCLSTLAIAAIMIMPVFWQPIAWAQEENINADSVTSRSEVIDPTSPDTTDIVGTDVNAEEPVLLDDLTNGEVVNLDELDEATIEDLLAESEVVDAAESTPTTSPMTNGILLAAAVVLLAAIVWLAFRKKPAGIKK